MFAVCVEVSEVDRLDTLRSTIALLPEENQEVLHCLLFFLQDISQHADEHQVSMMIYVVMTFSWLDRLIPAYCSFHLLEIYVTSCLSDVCVC